MTSRDDQSDVFLNSDTIDDEFFIQSVENKLNIKRDDFKLRLVLLSPATGKNENFMSVVYRAQIKIEILATKERKTVDVIVKALLSVIPELKEFSVFPRERLIYEDVLSSFEKIWLERAGETVQFGPRSIKFETDPYEIMVLDDLKAGGFQMLDRKIGLNMQQTKILLARLAKFHAASVIRYQKDGVINEKYFDRKKSMPVMPDDSPFVAGFVALYRGFSEAIKTFEGSESYAEKVAQWDTKRLFSQFIEMGNPMKCGFTVLNHGDLWLNNMMFKIDEDGNTTDVSMIDYQGPFWGGPAGDLIYFLVSSVADDIKVDHFDDFIEYYHEELVSSLKALKYDQVIPTLEELHADISEKGSLAGTCLMFILAVVKYSSSEEISIELIMAAGNNQEMLDRMYKNENFKEAATIWLKFFDSRGFLEALMIKKDE